MSALLERLGVELPVLQAGMGGGLARHELAAAVSDAGGLGTIGLLSPDALSRELSRARSLTGRPVAVNLLLPFARPAHWRAAAEADAVVTFWGPPERRTGGPWLHQCGSVEEARAARAAGADAVIAQGHEAGGHVRGSLPALELLARIRAALGDGYPVLVAGGIATGADVRAALDAGAAAAVVGTRFLLTPESGAHPGYRDRLVAADRTVVTELFGAGWSHAPHRVVENAATRRWLRADGSAPAALMAVQRAAGPVLARIPLSAQDRLARFAHPRSPLLSPFAPTDGSPVALVDAGPLYAGTSVARMASVSPAGDVVRELAGAA